MTSARASAVSCQIMTCARPPRVCTTEYSARVFYSAIVPCSAPPRAACNTVIVLPAAAVFCTSATTFLTKQPECIKFGTMRHYQLEGLNWMVRLNENGINGESSKSRFDPSPSKLARSDGRVGVGVVVGAGRWSRRKTATFVYRLGGARCLLLRDMHPHGSLS